MVGYRLDQRGDRLRRGRAPDRLRGVGPDGVVQIAELIDCRLQLGRRSGLSILRGQHTAHTNSTKDGQNEEADQTKHQVHPLRSDRLFILFLIQLQRELQITDFVAWKLHRVAAGVARAAVRRSLGGDGAHQTLEA